MFLFFIRLLSLVTHCFTHSFNHYLWNTYLQIDVLMTSLGLNYFWNIFCHWNSLSVCSSSQLHICAKLLFSIIFILFYVSRTLHLSVELFIACLFQFIFVISTFTSKWIAQIAKMVYKQAKKPSFHDLWVINCMFCLLRFATNDTFIKGVAFLLKIHILKWFDSFYLIV